MNIDAFIVTKPCANIQQLQVHREWMSDTADRHAYGCFPLTLTNSLGWGVSFDKDISFMWDGVENASPEHVKILEGQEFCSTGRGHATIGFNTQIVFRTDPNTTMLVMPVPNMFNKYAQCYTALISTSFYNGAIPIAWKIMESDRVITIPAGTPVATLVPVSLTKIQDYQITIHDRPIFDNYYEEMNKYIDKYMELNQEDKWSNMYRDAIDYNGDSIGNHEVKSLKLKTIKETDAKD